MRQYARLLVLFVVISQMISCTVPKLYKYFTTQRDVVLFSPENRTSANIPVYNAADIRSYGEIAFEHGLTTKEVSYGFINKRASFFDDSGRRKFHVLIIPGGDEPWWFESKPTGPRGAGINCQGVNNILEFVKSGGSIIAICHCGPSLFSKIKEWRSPGYRLSQQGLWDLKVRHVDKGWFRRLCGVYPFEGTVIGPLESNSPYPKAGFLPIKLNPENEIVQMGNLPPVIYMLVAGAGPIVPDEGQPFDVVGWFQDGTAAIGVVPYGSGVIIMCGPHPNITGERAERMREAMMCGTYGRWIGLTKKMIEDNWKIIRTNPDPDGPKADRALAKAMLSYAYKKALNKTELVRWGRREF
jgi:glutamine amidotransferase-like uncharacterized protein